MTKKNIPVIIIGCGPAGAATSLFLTKSGIAHLVLEKESFPRDKICGDGCSGKTVSVLNKADPGIIDEIREMSDRYLTSHGVIFSAPNGKQLSIPFLENKNPNDIPPGFTVRRRVLDEYLFQKTKSEYATIFQQATVQEIAPTSDGFSVTFSEKDSSRQHHFSSRLLVGADGDKGICRKQLHDKNLVQKTSAIGLRGYYEGVTGMHPENYIELHFLKEILPGYFWIFPLPGGSANVGIGMESHMVRAKKINLRETMRRVMDTNPTLCNRFTNARLDGKISGWGLPMSTGNMPISGDHYLLTGDAAALIDPFTGEGIGNALYSGMLAAEAAAEALQAGRYDQAFLKEKYDDVLFRHIGRELKLSDTLQRLSRHSGLFNFVINKARKSATLKKTFTHMLGDLELRDQLRKPSFYWNILINR